jgi:hypothetical protein
MASLLKSSMKQSNKQGKTDISKIRRRGTDGTSDIKSKGLSAGEAGGFDAKMTLP